jgi:hypothetical protein
MALAGGSLGASPQPSPCPTCSAAPCRNCDGSIHHLDAACGDVESAAAVRCRDGMIAARQREEQTDIDRPAPEGREWTRNEAGEPELVRTVDRLEEVPEAAWKDWAAVDRAERDQLLAAQHQHVRRTFMSPTAAQWRAFTQLRLERFPPPARRAPVHHTPAARRAPRRTGRVYRPAVRRTPRITRAGPSADDPEPELARPAAAAMVATAGAGILAFTRSRRDAVVLAGAIKTAIATYGVMRRG